MPVVIDSTETGGHMQYIKVAEVLVEIPNTQAA